MSSGLEVLDLCRLCLVKEDVSVPIFGDENDIRQIFLKITACLPVKVAREDKLPKKICEGCAYKIDMLYQFWNTSVDAEKQLLQWLDDVGGLDDKQGYVTEVLDPNVMKQEQGSDNRLDGSVMQVSRHQNSMDMGMMDNMSLMAMSGNEQQFTSVPMDTSGTVQTVQAVAGPSTQTAHDQLAQGQTHLVEEEEESEEDDNSDDGCDNDEVMPVKEETEEDRGDQPLESTTFVSLPCDEAGPSGLQQQKLSDMTEIQMQQTADGDPKTGDETFGGLSGMLRQILSPSSENDEMNFSTSGGCCNVLQQQPSPLFNTHHTSVLSSSLQMPPPTSLSHHHLVSMQEQQQQQQQQQQQYHDQVQILTETHSCPNCGTKLTYHIRTAHRDQADQLLDVGETQLMRFTCHACTRTFLAQSHMKVQNDQHQQQQQQQQQQQLQQQQQQQMVHISPRMQTNLTNPSSPNQTHYQPTTGQVAHQQQVTGQDKNFSCDRCQASFRYRTLLEKHKKMHDMAAGQDKPYSCPRCLMRFETRNLYNHHAKTHKPIVNQSERSAASGANATAAGGSKDTGGVLYNKSNNTYPCETCAKEFPTIESLTSHKAVHRSRPLICDVCGKGFTHRKYYVVHQRIHTGERPYLCAMCGKSFTQASTLTVHRRYHTGERPYTCTLCGKGFVTRTIMLNHMKKH